MAGLGLKRIPACTGPIGFIPSANRSLAGWMAPENMRKDEWKSACGSEDLDFPPSRFPRGETGAGMVPPTPRHVPCQPKSLARPMRRLPPQEGFAPLRDPPLVHIVLRTVTDQPKAWAEYGERAEDAATSALTFMTFS